MKRIFTLLVVTVVGLVSVCACMRKPKNLTLDTLPLVVGYVQDTTQALLPNAVVSLGAKSVTTSWDGRFVFEGATGAQSLSIRCEGYKPQKMDGKNVDWSKPLVVSLEPVQSKNSRKEDGVYYSLGRGKAMRSGEVYYKTLAATASDASVEVMGDAVYEEAEIERPHILPALNEVTAGKLTAGEVNDFAKWRLWEGIVDGSHKAFVKDWQLDVRHRYTVQVTNKNGYPIVNYPVNLYDAQGNTIFQTVTDNTGKAELWANLFTNAQQVAVRVPEKNIILDEPCTHTNDVDVVFVFDATGSMGDELRYLQAEMKDVIARASQATGGLSIRTGAVVYRDHGDEYLTRISRLTEDISTTQQFIDKQEANGGGDYEEAVPEALMAALNSAGWDENARARIAFLVLDAPCHRDSATLALLHEQILNAAALGVRIVPVVCSGIGESGELLLRSIALATNGTSFFLTDDSGIGNSHLKPTTDSLKVEHLNDMLVRTIVEFSYMPDCAGHWHEDEIENVHEAFVPNPFEPAEIEHNPTIPHGPTTLYLLDISGKLITIYEGSLDEASDSQLGALHLYLSTGIYFVKAFYEGRWYTKKILVH